MELAPETPEPSGLEDQEARHGNDQMDQKPVEYLDSKPIDHRDTPSTMFMPQSGADPEVSSGSVVAYSTAAHMQMPTPTDQAYLPETAGPTGYPGMLNTSMPPSYGTQSPSEVSAVDERRSSGQLEQHSPEELLYRQMVGEANMPAREKRDLLSSMSMYGPQFPQAPPPPPPSSRGPQWPNIETRVPPPPPAHSQQTSPSTAASEMPPTPTDYRLLQRPKGSVPPQQRQEHFLPPGMGGLEREQAQAPQSVPPPPTSYVTYHQPPLPPQAQWDHPDPATLVGHMDLYPPEMDQYTPMDAGTVGDLGPYGWVGGISAYGLAADDDKAADAFGEVMPGQLFNHV